MSRHHDEAHRAIDAAVVRALDTRGAAPLPEDFRSRVVNAAMAETPSRKRTRRALATTWLALVAAVIALLLAAPAVATAARATLGPLAHLLAPLLAGSLGAALAEPATLALLLAAPPVLWAVGYAATADVM